MRGTERRRAIGPAAGMGVYPIRVQAPCLPKALECGFARARNE
jgi:hypothetical protein